MENKYSPTLVREILRDVILRAARGEGDLIAEVRSELHAEGYFVKCDAAAGGLRDACAEDNFFKTSTRPQVSIKSKIKTCGCLLGEKKVSSAHAQTPDNLMRVDFPPVNAAPEPELSNQDIINLFAGVLRLAQRRVNP